MLIGEPPRTAWDLSFQLLGIPVRVHPFFWLVALMLGSGGGEAEPVEMAIWIVAVFVSIVIHEMGHALVARNYGARPWITLYGLGGLASYTPTHETTRSKILISAAGPAAGFALAALILVVVRLAGHQVVLVWDFFPFRFDLFSNPRLTYLVFCLLLINTYWGVINLLPVYPLDGGQIAREIFVALSPRSGIRQSLQLSIVCGVGLAGLAVMRGSLFMAFLFGYLAYTSYSILQAYSR